MRCQPAGGANCCDTKDNGMAIEFPCPHCGRRLGVAAESAGKQAKCPGCAATVSIPGTSPPTTGTPLPAKIFCPQCGRKNAENNFRCAACGLVLHGPTQPQYVASSDGGLGGLIPYKKPPGPVGLLFGHLLLDSVPRGSPRYCGPRAWPARFEVRPGPPRGKGSSSCVDRHRPGRGVRPPCTLFWSRFR